jgi:hypothetical protein
MLIGCVDLSSAVLSHKYPQEPDSLNKTRNMKKNKQKKICLLKHFHFHLKMKNFPILNSKDMEFNYMYLPLPYMVMSFHSFAPRENKHVTSSFIMGVFICVLHCVAAYDKCCNRSPRCSVEIAMHCTSISNSCHQH